MRIARQALMSGLLDYRRKSDALGKARRIVVLTTAQDVNRSAGHNLYYQARGFETRTVRNTHASARRCRRDRERPVWRRAAAAQRIRTRQDVRRLAADRKPRAARTAVTGVIERRAGSGSYVRADAAAHGYAFGLLIPELGRTEIFEPICRGMAEAQHGSQHVLLWGSSLGGAREHRRAGVSGLPSVGGEEGLGRLFRAAGAHARKGRDQSPYRRTSSTGRHSRRAARPRSGAVSGRAASTTWSASTTAAPATCMTAHLLKQGCRRIVFLGRPGSAPTVDARIGGYKEAMSDAEIATARMPHRSRRSAPR